LSVPTSRIQWVLTIGLLTALLVIVTATTTTCAGVEVREHSEGGLVGGVWELNVTVLGNVTRVEMSVDDGPPVELEWFGPGRYGTAVNTTVYEDGPYVVTISAYGGDGARDEVSIGVDVDNTAPDLTVEWPDGTVEREPLELTGSYDDVHRESVVAWVELVDGGNQTRPAEVSDGCLTVALGMADLVDGTNRMRVLAVDGAGNVATSGIHPVEVRKLPDLYLERMQFETTSPQVVQGIYTISYTVRNVGYVATSPFDIVLEADGETAIRRTVNGSLEVNGTLEDRFRWGPSVNKRYNLTVVVDPEDRIEELDEGNNMRTDNQAFTDEGACLASMVVLLVPGGVLVGSFAEVRMGTRPAPERRSLRPGSSEHQVQREHHGDR
jgi:hypothetical protein